MSHVQGSVGAEVSIIVVTHGARKMSFACLESVSNNAGYPRSEVIVVDNASVDGLAADIAFLYPEIRLLPQVSNLGFAAAANLGADAASGRYLLFLNPDTVVGRDTIVRLVEFARCHPRAGLVGVRTSFASGAVNPVSCRRKTTLWRLLCSGLGVDTRFPRSQILSGMAYARLPSTGEMVVDVICGACLLVERAVWDRLAGFSPAFFMYGEDEDFSLRAKQIGCSPTLALDFGIVHHGSGSEPDQARKLCQLLAARALVVRGYFGAFAQPIGQALLLVRPLLGTCFAKRKFRPLWQKVWAKRQLWQSGRFA